MDIYFASAKLRKQCNDSKEMRKVFGTERAKKMVMRLQAIHAAETLEDLRHAPGNFHELTADRKGQISCSLDGSYRLILEPAEDPPPIKEDGGLNWQEVKGLIVKRVEDYHG